MVEHTRAHPRLEQETPPGRREKLELGTLFLPAGLKVVGRNPGPLLLPRRHLAPRGRRRAQQGGRRRDPGRLRLRDLRQSLRRPRALGLPCSKEAETKAGVRFGRVMLGGWSAGCGAIRQILRDARRLRPRRRAP